MVTSKSPDPLSLGGTEESSLCYGSEVMFPKAPGVILATEDSPRERTADSPGGVTSRLAVPLVNIWFLGGPVPVPYQGLTATDGEWRLGEGQGQGPGGWGREMRRRIRK